MDATISLRIFGRSSSSFFDRLRSLPTGSAKFIFAGVGLASLLAMICLSVSTLAGLQPLRDATARIETAANLSQQLASARASAERAVGSGDDADFAVGVQSLDTVITSLDDPLLRASINDVFAIQSLEDSTLDMVNTFRSLGASETTVETRAAIRTSFDAAATRVDNQTSAILNSSITTIDQSVQQLSKTITTLTGVLLLLVTVLFALGCGLLILITRQSAHALHQIGQAAKSITAGNFDTRIDLAGERDADIVQLGAAFNHMAENLRSALQAESAASEQNRSQILKLARQERMTTILEERQRIARELHDSVKQQLFSITLSAGAVLNLLDPPAGVARTHLEHIRQAGHQSQAEMTALLQELVPVSLQDKRLEDALLDMLTPLCETHRLKLLWRAEGTNTLTIAQEHALFRAVQEAAANVIRHSEATLLRVSVSFGLVTHVIVEDNGKGFVPDAVPATSTGLSMMWTRLKRVGGRYELQSVPGSGTRLTLLLDLRRKGL